MGLIESVRDVLARLHATGLTDAVVAGGCLRDWDNAREEYIKDIDVFIQDRPMYLHMLNQAFPGAQVKVSVPPWYAKQYQFDGVKCVQNVLGVAKWPVQVVVMDRPVNVTECAVRNDFGICQISTFDGDQIFRSSDYTLDQHWRTFTLVRCRDKVDRARSITRFQRLSEKYRGWRFVNGAHI